MTYRKTRFLRNAQIGALEIVEYYPELKASIGSPIKIKRCFAKKEFLLQIQIRRDLRLVILLVLVEGVNSAFLEKVDNLKFNSTAQR